MNFSDVKCSDKTACGYGEYGCTAIHIAAVNGRVRTVQHLVENHSVDIRERNNQGKTALELAEEWDCAGVISYLRALEEKREMEKQQLNELERLRLESAEMRNELKRLEAQLKRLRAENSKMRDRLSDLYA